MNSEFSVSIRAQNAPIVARGMVNIMPRGMASNSITVLPSYANSPSDAEEAIELIRSGRVDVNPLITHRLPLEETARGFKLMTEAGESIKVVIEPHK